MRDRVPCPGGRKPRSRTYHGARQDAEGRWIARCDACSRYLRLRRRQTMNGLDVRVPPHKADPDEAYPTTTTGST